MPEGVGKFLHQSRLKVLVRGCNLRRVRDQGDQIRVPNGRAAPLRGTNVSKDPASVSHATQRPLPGALSDIGERHVAPWEASHRPMG